MAIDPVQITEMFLTNLQSTFESLSYLVGGVFGVYVIMGLMNWWKNRELMLILTDIKSELVKLNRKRK
ncbi:MAG: hypothetical protein WC471_03855 [Candidatus Woesearchaeota archaeon]